MLGKQKKGIGIREYIGKKIIDKLSKRDKKNVETSELTAEASDLEMKVKEIRV